MWEMVGAIYGGGDQQGAVPYTQELLRRPGYRPETGCNHSAPSNHSSSCLPIIHGGAHVGDGPPRFGTLFFFGMDPVVNGSGLGLWPLRNRTSLQRMEEERGVDPAEEAELPDIEVCCDDGEGCSALRTEPWAPF